MIDIDKTWNPDDGSLHDHRMKMLKELKQPGFPPRPVEETAAPEPEQIEDETDEDDDE